MLQQRLSTKRLAEENKHSQRRIKLARQDIILQDLLPPLMHRRLAVTNKPHALLHERTDIEVVRVSRVRGDDADAPALLHAHDHLVRDLRHVRLEQQRLLHLVQQRLGLVERPAVERDVDAAGTHLLQPLHDVGVLREVERFHPGLGLDECEPV